MHSEFTATDLQRALLESAAKLANLKVVVVERGDASEQEPGVPITVVFKQMWLHSTSAQVLMDWRENGNGEKWWEGFKPVEGPLTTYDLDSIPGLKACVDMTRDLVYADSRPLTRGPFRKSPTLHSVSKSPRMAADLFLPLVELDKPWVLPERYGGAPVVNAIVRRPLSAWRVLGEERLGGLDTVKAEIVQGEAGTFPLERHQGELTVTPTWLAWFSKSHGLTPLRAEQSVRYGFQGREYRLARRADGLSDLVYEASDFKQIGDAWFPHQGHQDTYYYENEKEGEKKEAADEFDSDWLVDKLLADGMLSIDDKMRLVNRREWRILSMESIDPSLNLWFEPQPGAEVVNMDTGKRFVQGDAVASEKYAARERAIAALIGKPAPDFPEGATWLNGQPLTWQALRGKVVILDFWSDWCGPCRNDLPELGRLHDARETNGLTIIGVHSPGSELESIKKVMDEFHLDYPICIDVPNRRGTKAISGALIPGDLSAQFAIDAIPHFVVVDASGVVVASETGRIHEVLAVANKLVNAAPSLQP